MNKISGLTKWMFMMMVFLLLAVVVLAGGAGALSNDGIGSWKLKRPNHQQLLRLPSGSKMATQNLYAETKGYLMLGCINEQVIK